MPDLYVVHRHGGSGRTEVHVLDGETGFRQWSAHANTPLGWTDESYDFAVDDWNGNGHDEVYALRRDGVSGRTGVQVLAPTRPGWRTRRRRSRGPTVSRTGASPWTD